MLIILYKILFAQFFNIFPILNVSSVNDMNLSKDRLYLNPSIYVGRSDTHRWGVFTDSDISQYDVLQESPYCSYPEDEVDQDAEVLRYSYESEDPRTEGMVIGFGFAAIFNHDPEEHNAAYHLDTVNETMVHFATQDIPAGSEIYLDYGDIDLSDFDL